MASVVGLVLFLAHLAEEIRVETMMRRVQNEASQTAHRTLGRLETSGDHHYRPPAECAPLPASGSGFLTAVHTASLVALAERHDLVIAVTAQIGSSVVEDTPMGLVWPTPTGRWLGEDELRQVEQDFATAVTIGFERTSVDDVGFGLRQLTDIAAKALAGNQQSHDGHSRSRS